MARSQQRVQEIDRESCEGSYTSSSTFAISAKRNGNALNSGYVVSRVSRFCKYSMSYVSTPVASKR